MLKLLKSQGLKNNGSLIVALLLSGYALLLRFQRLHGREFWTDETHQFNCIAGPFRPFWQNVVSKGYGDHTFFPGEYILTYPFVQMFGMDKWLLAIPHILMTVLGFYFLYRLCQRFQFGALGVFVTFLMVARNKNLVYHALEYRPYAVLPTLALGCLYLSDVFFKDYDRLSVIKKIGIVAFFTFTALYHAYGVLIFGLPIFYHAVLYRQQFFKNIVQKKDWIYPAVLLVLPLCVWLWYASSSHFGMEANTKQSLTKTWEFISNPAEDPVGFVKDLLGNLIGFRKHYFFLIPITASFLWLFPQWKRRWLFVTVFIAVPLTAILIVDLKSQYWFIQRQFVWVMMYFAILGGWSVNSIGKRFGKSSLVS